jgi:CRISPR-associated protein Csm3
MLYQLHGKVILKGCISCVTGLHIGGSSTGVEIGGLDNPVIKDPLSDRPYIPGSSLKGKLRSLTEWRFGLIAKHSKHKSYGAYESKELEFERDLEQYPHWDGALIVGKLFGPASDNGDVRMRTLPSRLTVRDSQPTDETQVKWKTWLGEGIFTEVKTENALDRLTAEANPRPLERVPAGSAFGLTMILDVYEKPGDFELVQVLLSAMHLLEQSSLGGAGSRGSGQIKFTGLQAAWRSISFYTSGAGEIAVPLPGSEVDAILAGWSNIQWPA